MNDQQLDNLFDQTIPNADENAKKIAINTALSEFSQGFDQSTRLTDNRGNWFSMKLKSIGSYLMTPQKNSRFNGTFASLAVAFIGVSVYFLIPESQKESDTVLINNAEKIGLEDNIKKTKVNEFITSQSPVQASKEEKKLLDSPELAPIALETNEEIVVTGVRATIQSSIEQKRIHTEIADGLSADEIGDIPALSVGEALKTVTGAGKPVASRSRAIPNKSITINEPPIAPPSLSLIHI